MSQGWRRIGLAVVCAQASWLAGCGSTQSAALPARADLWLRTWPSQRRRAWRMQSAPQQPKLAPPRPTMLPPTSLPPTTLPPPVAPIATTPPPAPTKTVSLTAPCAKTTTVRAWVNGRPIFDEEVMQSIPGSAWNALSRQPESQRVERLAEIFNQTLDQIIEQEIVYQDAIRKLEKLNPVTLDKLRKLAEEDFEKQLTKLIKQGVQEDELKELRRAMRKQMERSFISMEYVRSRIFPSLQRLGFDEIKEYYDTHQSEFTKVESLKWQNVFIAVNASRPTLAHARRFAEDLIATCRTGADFARLAAYDDGDAKFRGSEGYGSRRGEIRPAEIEPHLFRLRDGEIGPLVELSTGVHIFRLVERDPGGLMPLGDAVQNQIKNKLRSQMADREYRRVVRELRARAVVEVERDS